MPGLRRESSASARAEQSGMESPPTLLPLLCTCSHHPPALPVQNLASLASRICWLPRPCPSPIPSVAQVHSFLHARQSLSLSSRLAQADLSPLGCMRRIHTVCSGCRGYPVANTSSTRGAVVAVAVAVRPVGGPAEAGLRERKRKDTTRPEPCGPIPDPILPLNEMTPLPGRRGKDSGC